MGFRRTTVVVTSAARTETGNSGALAIDNRDEAEDLHLTVDVTAVTGAVPTLNLKVQWSADGGTTWADPDPADSFAEITAAKVVSESYTIKSPHYRVVWTLAGTTPSFTFSVREYVTA